MSGKRIFVGVLLALICVVLLVAGGVAIYQAGFAHGALTNLSLPEGNVFPMAPLRHISPFGWHAVPRIGLLGLFPLLCFGSFFFLVLLCGFGFFARKRAWVRHHYGPESDPEFWKHYGPSPWGSGPPPWAQNQPESESGETDQSEG